MHEIFGKTAGKSVHKHQEAPPPPAASNNIDTTAEALHKLMMNGAAHEQHTTVPLHVSASMPWFLSFLREYRFFINVHSAL